jgi:hypothetical protein
MHPSSPNGQHSQPRIAKFHQLEQENIQQVTSDIASINSIFAQFQDQVQHKFEAMDTKFTGEFDTLKSTVN